MAITKKDKNALPEPNNALQWMMQKGIKPKPTPESKTESQIKKNVKPATDSLINKFRKFAKSEYDIDIDGFKMESK